uniref:Uncharacterized protein n=1 Tax=Oryza meridionalis TaxID=40149 RepID=A0A0E0F7L5_9ORYZ
MYSRSNPPSIKVRSTAFPAANRRGVSFIPSIASHPRRTAALLCLGVPAPSARRDNGAFRRACNGRLALPRLLRPFFKSIGDGTAWRRASRSTHASDRSRDDRSRRFFIQAQPSSRSIRCTSQRASSLGRFQATVPAAN